jgi:hypothetical protein
MAPEVPKAAHESSMACLLNIRDHHLLRAKHCHEVSFGSQHEHLLKSRYGKVTELLPRLRALRSEVSGSRAGPAPAERSTRSG